MQGNPDISAYVANQTRNLHHWIQAPDRMVAQLLRI